MLWGVLLLFGKMLGRLMNDRWWRVGYSCVGCRVDCRSVDVGWCGHIIAADLEVVAYRQAFEGFEELFIVEMKLLLLRCNVQCLWNG